MEKIKELTVHAVIDEPARQWFVRISRGQGIRNYSQVLWEGWIGTPSWKPGRVIRAALKLQGEDTICPQARL
jgi:hypothetical protein